LARLVVEQDAHRGRLRGATVVTVAVVMLMMLRMMRAAVSAAMSATVAAVTSWAWVGVHLDSGRILRGRAWLVGANVGSEAVLVSDVVDVTVHAVGVLVAVAALDFPRAGALFMAVLRVAPAVVHVVAEAVRLKRPVVVVVAVVIMVAMVARERQVDGDGEDSADEN